MVWHCRLGRLHLGRSVAERARPGASGSGPYTPGHSCSPGHGRGGSCGAHLFPPTPSRSLPGKLLSPSQRQGPGVLWDASTPGFSHHCVQGRTWTHRRTSPAPIAVESIEDDGLPRPVLLLGVSALAWDGLADAVREAQPHEGGSEPPGRKC